MSSDRFILIIYTKEESSILMAIDHYLEIIHIDNDYK